MLPPPKSSSKSLKTTFIDSEAGEKLRSLAESRCQVDTFTAAMQAGLKDKKAKHTDDKGGGGALTYNLF